MASALGLVSSLRPLLSEFSEKFSEGTDEVSEKFSEVSEEPAEKVRGEKKKKKKPTVDDDGVPALVAWQVYKSLTPIIYPSPPQPASPHPVVSMCHTPTPPPPFLLRSCDVQREGAALYLGALLTKETVQVAGEATDGVGAISAAHTAATLLRANLEAVGGKYLKVSSPPYICHYPIFRTCHCPGCSPLISSGISHAFLQDRAVSQLALHSRLRYSPHASEWQLRQRPPPAPL